MAVIADSSTLIDFLDGKPIAQVEDAVAAGTLVFAPLAIAELLSGNTTPRQRETIGEWLQEFPLHKTPLAHWMAVGAMRRMLRSHGLNVTIPDTHMAQCALDLNATLLTRDEIFLRISAHTSLRLAQLR